jgi:collagenase-like PrtC family protease
MKLTLATNWDNNLILKISKLNKNAKNRVVEVFGSRKCDFLGSCRPAEILPDVSYDNFKKHIELCHRNNIKFNYVLNAISFHNEEFTPEFRNKVTNFVSKLVSFGVDIVTVANPLLIETIREKFPKLYICASTACKIDTLRRIQWYEELNVNRIILETDINRDFKLLRKIKESTKLELEILSNLSCIFQCPNNTYDYVCDGFRSQKKSTRPFYNYPKIKCTNIKLSNPVELIKSPWIRPEDVNFYSESGIHFLKIAGREASTPWLINASAAYMDEKYEGNLFDLIGNQVISDIGRITFGNLKKLAPLEVTLDNQTLTEFLNYFLMGKCNLDCEKCRYCDIWASNIKINEKQRNEYVDRSAFLLEKIKQNAI